MSILRFYTSEHAQAVLDLQVRYAEANSGVAVIPAEIYRDPGFDGGRNILLALDRTDRLLAYTPIFPRPVEDEASDQPHQIWTAFRFDPSQESSVPTLEMLYEHLLARADEVRASYPPRASRLSTECLAVEHRVKQYLLEKGWTHRISTYRMVRDLDTPIPDQPLETGIELRRWEMRHEEEQSAYLKARNSAFPESPWTLESLLYFLKSVLWTCGLVSASAFFEGRLVGSVLIYWDPSANERSGRRSAFTEEIFTVPQWRGRGIASACLGLALRLLVEAKMEEAHLEVRAANSSALRIYERLGYQTVAENEVYSLDL